MIPPSAYTNDPKTSDAPDADCGAFRDQCLGMGTCPACLNAGHSMDHHLAFCLGDGRLDLRCRNCQRVYHIPEHPA